MSMKELYRSEGEIRYLAQRAKEQKELEEQIAISNSMLVGNIREYKGVQYQMDQYGSFACINQPPLSGLGGTFTTAQTLHTIIDRLQVAASND
jgi:hypothetical protein